MCRTFGKCFCVTKPLVTDVCVQDCDLSCWMLQLHTNFHNNVELHSINGIVNIAALAKIRHAKESQDSVSLPMQSFQDILYGLQLQDKSPLFLSILPWLRETVLFLTQHLPRHN